MKKISNRKEILFRQVHPSWMMDGEPSSQAFIPTKKDKGNLSLDRSSTTPKKSYDDFLAQGFNSVGVFGITPEECNKEPYPIECFASPLENNQHHSHADFNELTRNQRKTKAHELRRWTVARGKLYPK